MSKKKDHQTIIDKAMDKQAKKLRKQLDKQALQLLEECTPTEIRLLEKMDKLVEAILVNKTKQATPYKRPDMLLAQVLRGVLESIKDGKRNEAKATLMSVIRGLETS